MKHYIITLLTLLCCFDPLSNVIAQETLKTKREPMKVHPFEAKKAFHQQNSGRTYPYRKIDGRNAQDSHSPNKFISLPGATLLSNSSVREIKLDQERHLPIFIRSQHPVRRTTSGKVFDSQQEAREITLAHVKGLDKVLALRNPEKELNIETVKEDKLGHVHVSLTQQVGGIPIFGADLKVHYSPTGERIVNGHHFPTPDLGRLVPSLSSEEALAIAKRDLEANEEAEKFLLGESHNDLEIPESTAKLVIYPDPNAEGTFHLAYEIDLHASIGSNWAYFVDAHYGRVINAYSQICSYLPDHDHHDHPNKRTAAEEEHSPFHAPHSILNPTQQQGTDLLGQTQTFSTYEVQDQQGPAWLMVDATKQMFKGVPNGKAFPGFGDETGVIVTLDFRNQAPAEDVSFSYVFSTDGQWDPKGVSAHMNATISYDYFEQIHGRTSIDNKGMDVVSFINVLDRDGNQMDNAFWNGYYMFYGNGNRIFTKPAQASLDIGGHEMTHGVISSSANLVYQGISGALNESFADVFGVMIDRDDFKMGEDIINSDLIPSGAARDMADPHNGSQPGSFSWQPKHMDEYVETQEDNGGVHINSGIPNYAAYLIIQEIGREKTEQIYYRALTQYLTRSSNFLDARLAIVQSAKDLYGAQAQEAQACARGFAAVGIGDPVADNDTPTDPESKTPPLETNPGDQFLLFTNTDFSCNCPLQRVDIEAGTIETISRTHHIRPVSVSDDGSLAIMITEDRKVNLIDLTQSPVLEDVVETEGVTWGNVVLSKDGNRFAAITDQAEGYIFVADLISGEIVQYELYNPTTGQGIVQSDVVLFADALEWDHSGQFLFYDALHSVGASSSRESDEYWDMGILHAWDNERNTFGSGQISKLFVNLPVGFDIGNPSLAKNSTHILTYEIVNFSENQFQILATNIETGDTQLLWENTRLGFPEYSVTDQQLIFSAENTDGSPILATVDLQGDKISPVEGSAQGIIGNAKWPVWYATGNRSLVPIGLSPNPGPGPGPSTPIKDHIDPSLEITLYPNPIAGGTDLNIQSATPGLSSLKLRDGMGRVVGSWDLQGANPQQTIRLPQVSAGIYLAELQAGEKYHIQRLRIQ